MYDPAYDDKTVSTKVKFIYVRDENHNPVGCFAYQAEVSGLCDIEISYGYSVRNPCDTFNKRVARAIAFGRMSIKPFVKIGSCSGGVNQLMAAIMAQVSRDPNHGWANHDKNRAAPLPMRFRKACERMAQHLVLQPSRAA